MFLLGMLVGGLDRDTTRRGLREGYSPILRTTALRSGHARGPCSVAGTVPDGAAELGQHASTRLRGNRRRPGIH